ncbi:MAG: flavin reductase family protein [Endomicrobiales bacterium]|nr:flavin reductase family protein [Endomicrobiales bacterium]
MTNGLGRIPAEKVADNVFKLIDSDWMLITAGDIGSFNMMTASWGGLGVLWSKHVAFCFVRPTRHTYSFMEKNSVFTLSFFEEKYRDALNLCGTKSGRDIDKAKAAKLTPAKSPSGSVCFAEARMVIECKKIYFSDIDPKNFIDKSIDVNYPKKDYHRMYVGEITNCLIKKSNAD